MKVNPATQNLPLHVQLAWLPEALHGTLFSTMDVLRVAAGVLQLRNPSEPCPLTWKVITPEGCDSIFDHAAPGVFSSPPPFQISIDRTLMIVPGLYSTNALDLFTISDRYPSLLRLLKSHAEQGGMIASTGNGLVFPARIGVLDGIKVNAHWAVKALFVQTFPVCDFSSEESIVFHDRIFTSIAPAQQTEFIIGILARVFDADISQVCTQLMQFQPQRQHIGKDHSHQGWLTRTSDSPVFRAKQWLEANLDQPYRLSELAAIASASERTLLRHFQKAIGKTPLEYLQSLRIERAKIMLEVSLDNLHTIATACGYVDVSSFRRLFHRATGMSPGEYRKRFTLRAKRVHWRVETAFGKK